MCRRHERVVFDGLIRSPYVVSFDDIPTQRFARGAVKSHSKLLMEEGPEVLHNHAGEKAVEIRLPMDFIAWLTSSEGQERIAAFLEVGDRKVVTTNTGTAALHVALIAAGVGPGDEVITPSFNYVADHQAVRMTGAEVAMCDITEDVLGIRIQRVAAGPRLVKVGRRLVARPTAEPDHMPAIDIAVLITGERNRRR